MSDDDDTTIRVDAAEWARIQERLVELEGPPLQPGDVRGRWTVVRRATPEQRGDSMRARVLCRCVCGIENVVWVGDLQRERSLGCKYASCRHRHAAETALRRVLPPQFVEHIMDLAAQREQPVHRVLDEALSAIRGESIEA